MAVPKLPSCWVHTGIGGLTELADVSGTGIEFIPKLPKCRVPVSSSYPSYRIVEYKYRSRTEQIIPVPPALWPRVFRYLGYGYRNRTALTERDGYRYLTSSYRPYRVSGIAIEGGRFPRSHPTINAKMHFILYIKSETGNC